MKLCDRCRVPGCLLDCGGAACGNARKRDCPDVVFTNADKIRDMGNEEMAELLCISGWRLGDKDECLAWLQKPAEVL